MESAAERSIQCPDCRVYQPTFFERYREFLLSRETILTFLNGILLILAFLVSLFGWPQIGRWIYLASALVGGTPLFLFAAKGLFIHHDITAGVMGSVAMIAAILVGEYSAAALVVFMMAVGEWLENFTAARADNALRDLARLIPAMVTVIREGQEQSVAVEEVNLEEVILVRTGERVGVDGVVLEGSGSLNQAAITGESMPVEKKIGDEVFAGTLNEVGTLKIRVSKLGADTTLGQIVKLVKEAQESQAPVQRVANQYAKILVPVTFTIAILVYLLSGDILRSITILVVVCPCALVLATPTAVVAAIGNAAKRGILIKSGAMVEQIGRVDVVAFDKTGTLTHGRPMVKEIIPLNQVPSDDLIRYAASAERFSEHPIGKSLVAAGLERKLTLSQPQEFTALPGFGVTAQVDGRLVVLGSRTMLRERGLEWTQAIDTRVKALESAGQTVIPVAIGQEIAGLITLVDTPRPEARQAIQELKRLGVKEVIMITGDNARAAALIAADLGLDRHFAEVLPQDKLTIIRKIQAEGKKIAFAGDGVNDAPALAAADIGIAMGLAGTDLAMETAGIGLMTDDINSLPAVIGLSRQALGVIRQNVIFSMSVNLLSVILGGVGIIGPVVGGLIHEGSALPVLANSVRLINFKLKNHP